MHFIACEFPRQAPEPLHLASPAPSADGTRACRRPQFFRGRQAEPGARWIEGPLVMGGPWLWEARMDHERRNVVKAASTLTLLSSLPAYAQQRHLGPGSDHPPSSGTTGLTKPTSRAELL